MNWADLWAADVGCSPRGGLVAELRGTGSTE